MTPITELPRNFCAGIGPLQLGVVLVLFLFYFFCCVCNDAFVETLEHRYSILNNIERHGIGSDGDVVFEMRDGTKQRLYTCPARSNRQDEWWRVKLYLIELSLSLGAWPGHQLVPCNVMTTSAIRNAHRTWRGKQRQTVREGPAMAETLLKVSLRLRTLILSNMKYSSDL